MTPKHIKIGRNADNDIVLSDHSISRYHLEVFIDDEGNVFITDLNSSNGTYINGNRIKGSELLQKGDILILGAGDPIRWSDWLSDDFELGDYEIQAAEVSSIPDISLTMHPVKKDRTLLVVLVSLALLIGAAIAFRQFQEQSKFEEKIYYNSDFRSMTYGEIESLIGKNVKLDANISDKFTTADGKDIQLKINNSHLIGVIELKEIGTPKAPAAVRKPTTYAMDSAAKSTTLSQYVNYGNGIYAVLSAKEGETLSNFRNRVLSIGYPNYPACNTISTASEIQILNNINTNHLPGSMWIKFKCY